MALSPVSDSSQAQSSQSMRDRWRQLMLFHYPTLLSETICVPPVHFNRVPYVRRTVPGTCQSALVLQYPSDKPPDHDVPSTSQGPISQQAQHSLWTPESEPQATCTPSRVQKSDMLDDFAQQHVLCNLLKLGKTCQEVMCIMSQLNFGDYLGQPSYAAAAAQFPRPVNLVPQYHHGDFDILLIHHHWGILTGELKAVGSKKNQKDDAVRCKVRKAVQQLEKSQKVVEHLLRDIAPGLTVRGTVLLPYVSRSWLQRVLNADPELTQNLCRALGAENGAAATQLCVCSDDVSDPATFWDITPATLSQLSSWWERRMVSGSAEKTPLNNDLYVDIVARFVGPASRVKVHCTIPPRVEVRTEGEAVSELGSRLAYLVLTQQQLDLMSRIPPQVCITGPPGTGKTICLVLMGLRWLKDRNDVHVICTRTRTLAVSHLIRHQLQTSLSADPTASSAQAKVIFHIYDIYFSDKEAEVDRAIRELKAASCGQALHVLMDELNFSDKKGGPRCQRLVNELASKVKDLHLWATSVVSSNIPQKLKVEPLTVPVRSAPIILREVLPGLQRYNNVHRYNGLGIPLPGDGLDVKRLYHSGSSHSGQWPVDCVECGKQVADQLDHLGVGTGGTGLPNSPVPLQYRDVFILTRSSQLQDGLGHAASGVVRGLRQADLPVCVLGVHDWINDINWKKNAEDTAVAQTDQVTVAHFSNVSGLERKVVVWLPGRWSGVDDSYNDELIVSYDRLYALSRCTTQLIVVEVP